ncbi:hypothetical protein GJ699_00160 [Duganella sp. FT80W]|uniref:Uncharacterized protein n=1 Tax=Duganella guangzhouensis TaxID=2666084 RepID=A0A6I2KW34_9BURK|nr:hypothetical protein [Duganella guangzhouensis]MRW88396.1 hypothetical protein [Duganella guangzhouensis]
MKAQIKLSGDLLVASLEDGSTLQHEDATKLADLLWANNVTAADVTMIDWHQDADAALLGGQKVAIFHRLRLHEQAND